MRVGIVKLGAIGSAVLLEYILDEIAMRTDIETVVIGTGSKIKPDVLSEIKDFDLVIVTCPNAGRLLKPEMLDLGTKTVVITDSAGKEWREEVENLGCGYIVVKADAMIGAKREFLDPTEMVLFNSDVLRVLAGTGVIRLIQLEINKAIRDEKYIPRVVVNSDRAIGFSGYMNPYAKAKAIAGFLIAEKVSEVTTKACFFEKDPEVFTTLCAVAHEMMRIAGSLVDDAREIEKGNDNVMRTPHTRDGRILRKLKLFEKLS